ncbi:CBS and ACT domain-containing protein [Desulfoluna spongiiphila]|uniref:Acetoin utilization protein AcuB n=1 Tax=Desulfoluna spongiiphila TaxID=419481 RepID=A0A1G5IF03_9BACT|nr:CBS and ACT domain-containing protein [Desulfoluna spongiiphila]SCY74270.1 acetoin utilization protein AcuB [Desulfoluna spongiiphila]
MYVGRIMHTNLITVKPETTIKQAMDLLKEHHIEHLVVLDDSGNLKGILSDRDVKANLASPATTFSTHELNYLLDQVTVGMIMVKHVITVTPGTTVEDAALVIRENEISSLPVMKEGRPVGIVTKTDVMGVLMDAIGLGEENERLIVLVRNRLGMIADITSRLRDEKINIASLITWPEKGLEGVYQLVIRVHGRDKARAINVLEAMGLKVITGYVEDHSAYVSD